MSTNNGLPLNEVSALIGRGPLVNNVANDTANAKMIDAMKADLRKASKSGWGNFNPMARYEMEQAARGGKHEGDNPQGSQARNNDAESHYQPRSKHRGVQPFYDGRDRKRVRLEETTVRANKLTNHGTSVPSNKPAREHVIQHLSGSLPPTPPSLSDDDSANSQQDYLNPYPVQDQLPSWYSEISLQSREMRDLRKKTPPELTTLDNLKAAIRDCLGNTASYRHETCEKVLRDALHRAEVLPNVVNFSLLLKKVRILEVAEKGLPVLFEKHSTVPADIKADAYQLYYRWWHGMLDQDLLRGIKTVKGKDRNGDRLDQTYRKKFPAPANFYGEGHLVPGQWWPTQLTALRDGAHGSSQGGIAGENEKRAYSIVLSSGGYREDKDGGDEIEYSGTDSKDGKVTNSTALMIKSYELQTPIRVLRSSQLSVSNKFRPSCGFRYDGLYKVTGYTVKDLSKQAHVFELKRLPDQTPIRCEDPFVRPTKHEVAEFEKLRKKW